MNDPYFYSFTSDISSVQLPDHFTFPFSYEPHTLTRLAAKELQKKLDKEERKTEISGKMYGVLIVKTSDGKTGYLCSFSGQDYDGKENVKFVPPLHDRLEKEGFFKKGEAELRTLNAKLEELENHPKFLALKTKLSEESKRTDQVLKARQLKKQEAKALRKEKRQQAMLEYSPQAYDQLDAKLQKESIAEDYDYKKFSKKLKLGVSSLQKELSVYEGQIQNLKKERKEKSKRLQKKLFDQYQFLNSRGKTKGIEDIFENLGTPPSGAGDCALPKLLQHAFAKQYTPLAMGEFWWGKQPKSELRKEGRFYPACSGKCKPILGHMLQGLSLEDDPLSHYSPEDKVIEIIYDDPYIAVINKPEGLLSIPSKEIKDCVLTRMEEKYPQATGPILAHRLDKLTSGLMLISKDLESHKYLQKQFMDKSIQKRYVAILEGKMKEQEGEVNLPLAVDEDNRPMQKVDFEKGRKALTQWKVIKQSGHQTLLSFTPITGRTHQLRVHSAHPLGLNAPICGDILYGDRGDRLMLHAESIRFKHPHTHESMLFEKEAPFML